MPLTKNTPCVPSVEMTSPTKEAINTKGTKVVTVVTIVDIIVVDTLRARDTPKGVNLTAPTSRNGTQAKVATLILSFRSRSVLEPGGPDIINHRERS